MKSRRGEKSVAHSAIAWGLAVAVHLLLALLLLFSVDWQSAPPAPVTVDLVAPIAASTERARSVTPGTGGEIAKAEPKPEPKPAAKVEPQPKPEPKPEPPPKPQPEPKGEPKPQPKAEPQPKPAAKPEPKPEPKPEIAQKAPQKTAEPKPEPQRTEPPKREPEPKPEPKPTPKPEPQPKPEPKPQPKPEPKPEPKPTEEDFARLARERPAAKTPANDPVAERLLALAQGRSGAPSGPSDAARASYIDAVRAKVRQHVVVPPGVTGNPEALFDVTQMPDGTVVEVRLVRSSGIPALDAALERAIHAASPLPVPPDPRLFERQLRLILRPLAQ